MISILPFVVLSIIASSVFLVLESPDSRTTLGITSNPNCALAKKDAGHHGLDLSLCDLRGANLKGINFHNANLAGANLQNADLQNTNLSGANLSKANLSGANLRNANLHNANLAGANLQNTKLQNNYLTGVKIVNEILTGTNLQNATLQNANLIVSNISNENLTDTNLQNATLQNANPTGTSLAIAITAITNSTSVDSAVDNSAVDNSTSVNSASVNSPSVDSTSANPVNDNSVNTGNISEMLTIQTVGSYLVPGTSYTITPSPKTGTGSLLVTDGGIGDDDGINDGLIKLSKVFQGSYVIKQVTIPSGFSSLLDSTTININTSYLDLHVTFQVTPTSTDISTLPSTTITSPSLSTDTFNQWTTFSATIVNNVNSASINSVDQTPQVIAVGTQNSTAIGIAVNSQSSVSLDVTFAPLTNGLSIINKMGLENYSLPKSTDVVSVIPTIVARINDTTDYVVATPPFSEIIPGQEMIIPMADSLLPSFGGLKQIDVQSSPTAQPVGEKNTEWLVAQVDNKIPSSINSSGIDGTPVLFVNIQHPFEETGSGFNWSDPANHAVPPLLTLVINKDASDDIQIDSQGCPVVNVYTLIDDSWTSDGVSEVSSSSISSSQCEIIIQSQHLSKFAFSLQHLSSLGPFVAHSPDYTFHHSTFLPSVQPASALQDTAVDTTANGLPTLQENLASANQATLQIPLWVKDNAKGWHDGVIDDSDFALGVQYMMQQNIIKTPEDLNKNIGEPSTKIVLQEIPSWVKNDAYWWSQEEITDYDYVNGIQWLISNQIIKIS